ncbi:hypothetical protein AVEN_268417-1 [Araneus ventricosus]|uniref:HAT C-terminal dimerisation domain-containing protein n=1 Tax=Araneus ventricosus TaxID=182803 RepID=A0A4Y2DUV4_ARAVE|nr:hypothetical protein AVEN_268417-1 [Araneus ventricosus]
MRSLKVFLKDKINDLVDEALQFAKDTCEEMGIPVIRKKIMPGEKTADEPLTWDQELKISISSTPKKISKTSKVSKEESLGWASLRFLELVVGYELFDSVPDLTLALRFLLTLCVSVASCERSFSKFKLIKNYLRSTMNQARLSSLAILSIGNSVAGGVGWDCSSAALMDEPPLPVLSGALGFPDFLLGFPVFSNFTLLPVIINTSD